jgi:hypothetical protein
MTGRDAPRAPVAGAILLLVAGPMLWALHFFLIYGPQSALCALRPGGAPGWPVTAFVLVATLAALAALLLLLRRPRALAVAFRTETPQAPTADFLFAVARLLTILATAGVLWAGGTALILDPCGQLRAPRQAPMAPGLGEATASQSESPPSTRRIWPVM